MHAFFTSNFEKLNVFEYLYLVKFEYISFENNQLATAKHSTIWVFSILSTSTYNIWNETKIYSSCCTSIHRCGDKLYHKMNGSYKNCDRYIILIHTLALPFSEPYNINVYCFANHQLSNFEKRKIAKIISFIQMSHEVQALRRQPVEQRCRMGGMAQIRHHPTNSLVYSFEYWSQSYLSLNC